ncbi:MAG: LamG domain-containing protein, partial [Planctomycetes bacterium]|nr:LamG domain-containing protein [Planctomycetota bacterium]
TDALGEGMRIALPERLFEPDLALESVPTSLFEARDFALTLDGRGSCVKVRSENASPPDGPLTLECWVNAPSYSGRRPIVAKSETSEYYLFASEGKPSFGVHVGGQYVTAEPTDLTLTPNQWIHLAGVFDGREVRLYVDGKLVASKLGAGDRTKNALPLYVGADPNRRGEPVDTLLGRIDEVRLSDTARYADDTFVPTPRHEPDARTLLLLHCDHDLGPFTIDHSPAGAHPMRLGQAKCLPILSH